MKQSTSSYSASKEDSSFVCEPRNNWEHGSLRSSLTTCPVTLSQAMPSHWQQSWPSQEGSFSDGGLSSSKVKLLLKRRRACLSRSMHPNEVGEDAHEHNSAIPVSNSKSTVKAVLLNCILIFCRNRNGTIRKGKDMCMDTNLASTDL